VPNVLVEQACFGVLTLMAARQVAVQTRDDVFGPPSTSRVAPRALQKANSGSSATPGRKPVAPSTTSTPSTPIARTATPRMGYEPIPNLVEDQAPKSIKRTPKVVTPKATQDSPLSSDDAVLNAKRIAQEKLEARRKARIEELRS